MFEYAVPFKTYHVVPVQAFGPQIATDPDGERLIFAGMFWVVQVVGIDPGMGHLGTHVVCMN